MPARALAVAMVSAAAVVVAACSADGSGRPVPRIPHAVVDVTMREYGFDYKQPVPDGRVVFRVVNNGTQIHRLTMIELPEELPPIGEQLRGRRRRNVSPFAGLPGMRPGERNSFAVDLVRGRRYGMIDPTGDSGGRSNALLGLNTEFRAGGGPPGPRAGAGERTGAGERKRAPRKGARARKPERRTSRPAKRRSRPARRPSRSKTRARPKPGVNPADPKNPANAGVERQGVRP